MPNDKKKKKNDKDKSTKTKFPVPRGARYHVIEDPREGNEYMKQSRSRIIDRNIAAEKRRKRLADSTIGRAVKGAGMLVSEIEKSRKDIKNRKEQERRNREFGPVSSEVRQSSRESNRKARESRKKKNG